MTEDEKVNSTEKFIKKASEVHKGNYGYSKSKYTRSIDKIVVTCYIHGDWSITPNNHLRGKGCLDCANIENGKSRRSNTEDFINKAGVVHKGRYEYSKSKYRKAVEKLIITCKIHGDFHMTPNTHLCGGGCTKCAIEIRADGRRKSLPQFIKESRLLHQGKYTYEKTEYTGHHNKTTLTCKLHGDFVTKPSYHLLGKGCPKCGFMLMGYSKSQFRRRCVKNNKGFGKLYILLCYNDTESFYKVGIASTSIAKRYSGDSKITYKYEVIKEVESSPNLIYDIENHILRDLVKYSYKPSIDFKGKTECFSELTPILDCLEKYLNDDGVTND